MQVFRGEVEYDEITVNEIGLILKSGFTEFRLTSMSRSAGAGPVLYCVWPGNKKSGYCSENVTIRTASPAAWKARARRSL